MTKNEEQSSRLLVGLRATTEALGITQSTKDIVGTGITSRWSKGIRA
jgi:hypothetical protein